MLPADRLEVAIAADGEDDDTRHVRFDALGGAWTARRDALAAVANSFDEGAMERC